MQLGNYLRNPWLTIRVQIALGVFFVAAALPKIVDPPSFAHMVYNYRIVPGAAINLMALVMPWIELLSGLALILGIWTGTARTIVAALLVTFIIAISINLARHNAIDADLLRLIRGFDSLLVMSGSKPHRNSRLAFALHTFCVSPIAFSIAG